MKVWISKYALSEGIQESDAKDVGGGYVSVNFNWLKLGVAAHTSRQDAIVAAEKLRQKKLASLQKQIKKLETLRFE